MVSSSPHAHNISKLGCIIYVEIAINLIKGFNKEISYENAIEFVKKHCRKNYEKEFIHYKRIMDLKVGTLKEEEISSSGYVVSSLEAALWSFLRARNYREGVLKAINLGKDTDTIGALAGGILGIFYGINSIPENWVQCLARRDDIYKLCLDWF